MQQLVDALSSGQIKPSLPATPEAAPSNAAPPTVRLRGWVRSIRTSKVTSFLTLNDGTSLLSVQCVLDVPVAERCLPAGVGLSNGCSIEVEGQLLYSYKVAQGIAKAQVAGSTDAATLNPLHNLSALISTSSTTPLPQLPVVEILVSSIHLHGACDGATYPIAKQTLPFDHLREFMHLRTRTATLAAVMRIRSRAQMGVHEFFQSEGFFNVHTPILTPLDCEGAGEVFSQSIIAHNAELCVGVALSAHNVASALPDAPHSSSAYELFASVR